MLIFISCCCGVKVTHNLKVVMGGLKSCCNIEAKAQWPRVSYKETIRWSTGQHDCYKRQIGELGQFRDVHLTTESSPHGTGSILEHIIIDGAVPSNISLLLR